MNKIIIYGYHDLSRLLTMNFYIPVSWYAIFTPVGTPRDVATRIRRLVKRVAEA